MTAFRWETGMGAAMPAALEELMRQQGVSGTPLDLDELTTPGRPRLQMPTTAMGSQPTMLSAYLGEPSVEGDTLMGVVDRAIPNRARVGPAAGALITALMTGRSDEENLGLTRDILGRFGMGGGGG